MASKQRYVIFCGEVFRWEEKEPFIVSGKSVHGALEYDRETETVKCHVCGKFLGRLSSHIKEHGLTGRQYKINHALQQKTALLSPVVRTKLATTRTRIPRATSLAALERGRIKSYVADKSPQGGERKNRNGTCAAQTLAAIKSKAMFGKCPTAAQVGIRYVAAAVEHFGSWTNACRIAGFTPNVIGASLKPTLKIDRATMIETLRDFYVLNGRVPLARDCNSSARLFTHRTYKREFGGWSEALGQAGLSRACERAGNIGNEVAA